MPLNELADLITGARRAGDDRQIREVIVNVGEQRRHARIAAFRLLLHSLAGDGFKFGVEPLVDQAEQRGRRLTDGVDRIRETDRRALHVWMALREQPVEDHSERVDIGARVDAAGFAACLLGTHERQAALDQAAFGDRGRRRVSVGEARQAKVKNLHRRVGSRGGDEDVRRLEVAVNDAVLMGVDDGVADGAKQVQARRGVGFAERGGRRLHFSHC